eukprot:2532004-Alexandrium_andersonii.AAC.1
MTNHVRACKRDTAFRTKGGGAQAARASASLSEGAPNWWRGRLPSERPSARPTGCPPARWATRLHE